MKPREHRTTRQTIEKYCTGWMPATTGFATLPENTEMTYEEFLDEVATLLTEIYTLSDEAAIDIVMRAQADGFFSGHDDAPSICTQQRAELDARAIFKAYKPQRPARRR